MKIKIYVLSLSDAFERRKSIALQLNGVDFEFFDGVYGKDMAPSAIREVYNDEAAIKNIGRSLTKGEIGATYSHAKIYEKAIKDNCDYALIIEDDCLISEKIVDFIRDINTFFMNIPPDSISFIQRNHTKKSLIINSKLRGYKLGEIFKFNKILGSTQYIVGSNAYLCDRIALSKLNKSYMPFYFVCDHWFFVRKVSKIKNYYFLDSHIVAAKEDNIRFIDSEIEDERKKVKINSVLSTYAKIKYLFKKVILMATQLDLE